MPRIGLSALPFLAVVLGAFALHASHGLVILESTAAMQLTYDDVDNVGGGYDLPDIYTFEETTAQIFLQSLQQSDALGEGNEALTVTVAVQASTTSGTSRTVLGTVTCVYLSYRIPGDLDTALMRGVNSTALSQSYANAKATFRPSDKWLVLDKYQDNGLTAASKGLLAATIVLSAMLVAVSAVLLHITGGWSVCHQRICNCLFEEVEYDGDDNYNNQYDIEPKDTFQVEGSAYGDGEDADRDGEMMAEADEQSVATGMQTNPSGVLGVQQRDSRRTYYNSQQQRGTSENPAAGLGILGTPNPRGDFDYGDETPMSTSDRPLGITSMRELPQSDNTPSQERGGLAHMIMERLTHYSGTSNHHTTTSRQDK